MKFTFIPLAVAAAGLSCQTVVHAASPVVPAGLVPPGWVVLGDGAARGDLNRDGRPDLALALAHPDEAKRLANGGEAPRQLVVFFGQKTGGYKRVFVNQTAIMGHDDGGMLGDPFQGLQIRRGVLLIDHWGGSREMWNYTHRFRFESGQWRLIGLQSVSTDRATNESEGTDTNFLTGEVEVSTDKNDKSTKHRFLQLRAPSIGQSGNRIKLGPATIWANLDGPMLLLQARLPKSGAQLRLRDAKGHVVKPIGVKVTPIYARGQKIGVIRVQRYSWKMLSPRESYSDQLLVSSGDDSPVPESTVDAAVEIAVGRRVWKTSRAKQPGRIVSTRQVNLVLPPWKEG